MNDYSLAIYANTSNAVELSRKLARSWPRVRLFIAASLADEAAGEEAFSLEYSALALNWRHFSGHLVFGDAAATVQAIASMVAGNQGDLPNVVLVDDQGRFVTSLVENPRGPAFDLALRVAEELGGQMVFVSETPQSDLPSLEDLIEHYGLKLQNNNALPKVKRALQLGKTLPIYDPQARLWPFLKFWSPPFKLIMRRPGANLGRVPLIWVDHELSEHESPNWILVRPVCLAVGVDCRRALQGAELVVALVNFLQTNSLSPASIKCLAASDDNREMFGLTAATKRLGVPLRFYRPEQLSGVLPHQRRTILPGSRRSRTCEAVAVAASGGGTLLLSKDVGRGLHLAVALESGSMHMTDEQAIAK